MSDGEEFPYVQDVLTQYWHRRPSFDEPMPSTIARDSTDGPTYGTICGKEVFAVHISTVHPDEIGRHSMCRMCRRLEHHDHLITSMAEHAHNAWWRAYRRLGFTSRKAEWGEEFMVPFEQLSEKGKEFDRTIMRAILVAMWERGYSVFRRNHG